MSHLIIMPFSPQCKRTIHSVRNRSIGQTKRWEEMKRRDERSRVLKPKQYSKMKNNGRFHNHVMLPHLFKSNHRIRGIVRWAVAWQTKMIDRSKLCSGREHRDIQSRKIDRFLVFSATRSPLSVQQESQSTRSANLASLPDHDEILNNPIQYRAMDVTMAGEKDGNEDKNAVFQLEKPKWTKSIGWPRVRVSQVRWEVDNPGAP